MPSTSPKLRIAAIGCGRMGQKHIYNVQHRTPRAELVAIADPGPLAAQWAKQNAPDIPFFSDANEVFDLANVDAVVISTTTNTHAPLTLKAIAAGKHVLLEKPISIDDEDSRPVVEAANAHPEVKVAIGFVRRYDAALNQLRDHIVSNAAGKPFILKSTTCDAYDSSGFFVAYARASGGIFMDCGIHDIDMARWLLGIGQETGELSQSASRRQVKRVIATGSIVRHPELSEQDDCDNALGIVEFTNGSTCTLHLSRTGMNGYESTVDVYGLEQKLTVETPNTNRVKVADGQGRGYHSTPQYIERFGEAFVNEMNDFTACCLDDKPVKTTANDALQASIIAHALTHAFRKGVIVEFGENGEPKY